MKTTITTPANPQGKFILFNPEKAPEYSVVMDIKDRELVYLGKDKEKAQRILNALNMHDELVLALTQAVILLPQNGKFGDTPNEFKYENKTTALLYKLLKQAEQK